MHLPSQTTVTVVLLMLNGFTTTASLTGATVPAASKLQDCVNLEFYSLFTPRFCPEFHLKFHSEFHIVLSSVKKFSQILSRYFVSNSARISSCILSQISSGRFLSKISSSSIYVQILSWIYTRILSWRDCHRFHFELVYKMKLPIVISNHLVTFVSMCTSQSAVPWCLMCDRWCPVVARLLHDDPYNSLCLPLNVAVLVELKKQNGKPSRILLCRFTYLQLICANCIEGFHVLLHISVSVGQSFC